MDVAERAIVIGLGVQNDRESCLHSYFDFQVRTLPSRIGF
jgi:hypothetical protein